MACPIFWSSDGRYYDEMQEFASEMLGEFKQRVVMLTRTVTAPPDPSTPWIPGEPVTTV